MAATGSNSPSPKQVEIASTTGGDDLPSLSLAQLRTRLHGAELTLLHVLEHFPDSADLQRATTEVLNQLDQAIPAHERAGCSVNAMVRTGKPYRQIIELALETQTDLVMMGVRGRGALDAAVFGSTTYRVVQLGSCPVLAVTCQPSLIQRRRRNPIAVRRQGVLCDLRVCTISL